MRLLAGYPQKTSLARLKTSEIVRSESGQSLVEMVIVLPLLLIILAGVFDVGRSMQAYVVLLNASREAAMRGAATETDTNTLRTMALAELNRGGLDAGLAEVTVEYQMRGFPEENHVIVQVEYSMPLLMAVLSIETMNLSSQTEMVVFW